jgi:hypothetical protein
MASKDLILVQRNAANTANVRRALTPGSGMQVLHSNNGNLVFIDLFDPVSGELLDSLIPRRAKPTVRVVANQAARFGLAVADVQNGDVVWQDDEGKAYFVVDDTKLNLPVGYKASASVTLTWNDIQNKPAGIPRLVTVPANSSAIGAVGDYAVDDDNYYKYVGDGTIHKWLQFAGNTF